MGASPSTPQDPQASRSPLEPSSGAPPEFSPQDVEDLLKRARAFRFPGVEGGLYGVRALRDASPNPSLAVPTLVSTPPPLSLALSDEEFSARLGAALPELGGFPLKAYGLFLAGGCAAAVLTRASPLNFFDDVDLFLVGHADDSARLAAIAALGAHLASKWGRAPRLRRSVNAVSFSAEGRPPFQVILRGYRRCAEVLHGFDLGSCSVGFDGDRLFLTELGVLASRRGLNLLCLDGWRPSYTRRLVKYFHRGYSVVLPRLRPGAFDRLPFLWARRSVQLGFLVEAPYLQALGAPPRGDGSYEAGGGSRLSPASRNALCLLSDPPRLEGMVASHPFLGPESLYLPALASEGFAPLIASLSGPSPFKGPLRFFAALPESSAFLEAVAGRLRSLQASYSDGFSLPLAFRGVDADTLLTPVAGRLSEADWYGPAYDGLEPSPLNSALYWPSAEPRPSAEAPPSEAPPKSAE